jgi:hypothetical protein
MSRVHALVVVVLVLTVAAHAALAGLGSRVSRRARIRKGSRFPSPDLRSEAPLTTDRRVDVDRTRSSKGHHHDRGVTVYGACAGCGMPFTLTHSSRRRLRQ